MKLDTIYACCLAVTLSSAAHANNLVQPAAPQQPTTAGAAAASANWDPFESFNRSIYSFNSAFGGSVASEVATGYRATVPEEVQAAIDNFFTNLREPLTFVASTLNADFRNAGTSAGRFAINTTAGIGGLFDVATKVGWVSRPQDFGTTLCKYKLPAGPYVVLPFIGPSTVRDTAGSLASYIASYWALGGWGRRTYILADRTASYLTDRAPAAIRAAALPAASVDGYAEQRRKYLELRDALCKDSIPAERLKASPLGRVIVKPLG
jgi:phospholipid-binding lipoprotein MlaA